MRIHAIQTGSVAIKTRQMRGEGHGLRRNLAVFSDPVWTDPLPIYAWLIEHPEGLIVVDTGETSRTAEPGYFPSWHPYFRRAVRSYVAPEEEIGPKLRAMGFDPSDVRWVVMTHLHTDHAGGLGHFPKSEILVSRSEFGAAGGALGKLRGYLPQHWPGWLSPRFVDFSDGPLGPFPTSQRLTKAGDVVLLPTPGHSPGHLSVAVMESEQTVLFAGDLSYTERLMLDQAVDGVSPNERLARESLQRMHALATSRPLIYLPSHDPHSPHRLHSRTPAYPAAAR